MNDSLTCSRLPRSAYDEWEPAWRLHSATSMPTLFRKQKGIGPWESPPLSQGHAELSLLADPGEKVILFLDGTCSFEQADGSVVVVQAHVAHDLGVQMA